MPFSNDSVWHRRRRGRSSSGCFACAGIGREACVGCAFFRLAPQSAKANLAQRVHVPGRRRRGCCLCQSRQERLHRGSHHTCMDRPRGSTGRGVNQHPRRAARGLHRVRQRSVWGGFAPLRAGYPGCLQRSFLFCLGRVSEVWGREGYHGREDPKARRSCAVLDKGAASQGRRRHTESPCKESSGERPRCPDHRAGSRPFCGSGGPNQQASPIAALAEMEGLLRRGRGSRLRAEPQAATLGAALGLDESEGEEELGDEEFGLGDQPGETARMPLPAPGNGQAEAFAVAMFRMLEGYHKNSAKGSSTLDRALDGAGGGSGEGSRASKCEAELCRAQSAAGRPCCKPGGAEQRDRDLDGRGFGICLSRGSGARPDVSESMDGAQIEDLVACHRRLGLLDHCGSFGLSENRPPSAGESSSQHRPVDAGPNEHRPRQLGVVGRAGTGGASTVPCVPAARAPAVRGRCTVGCWTPRWAEVAIAHLKDQADFVEKRARLNKGRSGQPHKDNAVDEQEEDPPSKGGGRRPRKTEKAA